MKHPERTIKRKFNAIAGDNGVVEMKDFRSLLQELDIDVNLREAEMIFVSMDKDLDLGISFEGEFSEAPTLVIKFEDTIILLMFYLLCTQSSKHSGRQMMSFHQYKI